VEVEVIGRQVVDGWVKYTLAMLGYYKRDSARMKPRLVRHGGQESLWIPESSFVCKCPKIRPGKKYLIMGKGDTNDPTRPGIVLNRRTIVMDWSPEFDEKLKRLLRKERQGLCPGTNGDGGIGSAAGSSSASGSSNAIGMDERGGHVT